MPGTLTLTAQQLLDGMPGPVYVVDGDGRFLLVGRRNWGRQVAGAPGQVDPATLVGRNLFDFICGDDVQDLYRAILRRLRADPSQAYALPYRCDAPGMMREFRLTVSAVDGEDCPGFLFASQPVQQLQRPPIPLFDYQAHVALLADPSVPVLTICSLCHRVKANPGEEQDPGNWIDPEQYYRDGGSSRVSLSHGLCPDCYQQFKSDLGLPARR